MLFINRVKAELAAHTAKCLGSVRLFSSELLIEYAQKVYSHFTSIEYAWKAFNSLALVEYPYNILCLVHLNNSYLEFTR